MLCKPRPIEFTLEQGWGIVSVGCFSVIKYHEQKQLTGRKGFRCDRRGVCHREVWQRAAEAGDERSHPAGTQEAEEELEVGSEYKLSKPAPNDTLPPDQLLPRGDTTSPDSSTSKGPSVQTRNLWRTLSVKHPQGCPYFTREKTEAFWPLWVPFLGSCIK